MKDVHARLEEVFARHADGYLAKHGKSVLPSHRRAIRDIVSCRAEAMGGHVFRCDSCGREVYAYQTGGRTSTSSARPGGPSRPVPRPAPATQPPAPAQPIP